MKGAKEIQSGFDAELLQYQADDVKGALFAMGRLYWNEEEEFYEFKTKHDFHWTIDRLDFEKNGIDEELLLQYVEKFQNEHGSVEDYKINNQYRDAQGWAYRPSKIIQEDFPYILAVFTFGEHYDKNMNDFFVYFYLCEEGYGQEVEVLSDIEEISRIAGIPEEDILPTEDELDAAVAESTRTLPSYAEFYEKYYKRMHEKDVSQTAEYIFESEKHPEMKSLAYDWYESFRSRESLEDKDDDSPADCLLKAIGRSMPSDFACRVFAESYERASLMEVRTKLNQKLFVKLEQIEDTVFDFTVYDYKEKRSLFEHCFEQLDDSLLLIAKKIITDHTFILDALRAEPSVQNAEARAYKIAMNLISEGWNPESAVSTTTKKLQLSEDSRRKIEKIVLRYL